MVITIVYIVLIILLCLIIYSAINKTENFGNDENVFGFNPYIYPVYEKVKDEMILPTKSNTGDINKWEKRFPYLVNQRYSYNDRYPDICDNGDYIFKESAYSLADKALLTELPLKLSNKWTNKSFVEDKYLYDGFDKCPKIINNFDEKYRDYGPFVSEEKNIKYRAYEPTYFDYLDVIY